ncbi:MAG: hypothetical protein WCY00_01440 [Candidatus Dojkabacteria bacterium]|jgi:Tfp pilus assembly protein PilO
MREKKVTTAEYIKLIKESPEKRRSYIYLAFTIFTSIVLIVFAIRPTILTITKISSEIKEKEKINKQLEAKINALTALDREYEEHKDDFRSLELIFPVSRTFTLLTSNIEPVVTRNGFSLMSVSFDAYKGKEYKQKTRFLVPSAMRLSVRGRRVNIVNLLKDLESLPTYGVAESVSYSQREDDELGSFSINMRIFTVESDKFYD